MVGVKDREQRHFRLIAWQAWHTAALARSETMPRLETLWGARSASPRPVDVQPGPDGRQTPEQMLAIAQQWAAVTGKVEGRTDG